jgi:hypothetical protein
MPDFDKKDVKRLFNGCKTLVVSDSYKKSGFSLFCARRASHPTDAWGAKTNPIQKPNTPP